MNFTEPVVKEGPEFSVFDDIVYTVEDMQNMFRKVCVDPKRPPPTGVSSSTGSEGLGKTAR